MPPSPAGAQEALLDRRIRDQNPWWANPGAIEADPHISRLRNSPFQSTPAVLDAMPLTPGDVNTLRGPRQVGKTTTAKRLIQRLLDTGESRVLYYAFDVDTESSAIPEVIRRAKTLARQPAGPWYVFLDEVTAIPDWQRGVKYAWDVGMIHEDFVLCTGSSAHRMGAEQLPGRRGGGRNYIQLGLSFREFCAATNAASVPDETTSVRAIASGRCRDLLGHLYLIEPQLDGALIDYLRVGGFPAAVADHIRSREVSANTVLAVWSLLSHEIQQVRLDSTSALKLIERVGISLGSTLSWQSAAEAMDARSHHTAQEYVTALAEAFALLVLYHWRAGSGFEPRKQRKVFFFDPLVGHIPAALSPGAHRPNEDGMRENLVAAALFRSASDHIVQAAPVLGALGYWRSAHGREVDFVVEESPGELGSARIPVEVKGDASSALREAASSMERSFGRGVIVTRRVLDLEGAIPKVPLSIFLAALGDRTERRLSTL